MKWPTYDQVMLSLTALGTISSAVAMMIAFAQLRDAALAFKYDKTLGLIDDAAKLSAALLQEPASKVVLGENRGNAEERQRVAERLEDYQTIIFKYSVLAEKNLIAMEFYSTLAKDFCALRRNYRYFRGWWEEKKSLEPYRSLSKSYGSFADRCEVGMGSFK